MKTIRQILGILLTIFMHQNLFSQNTGISDINHLPDSTAVLDVYSTSKGILIPRLTEAQRIAIVNPALGLLVYQKDNMHGFYYFDGTVWSSITTLPSQWITSGNNIYYATGKIGIGNINPLYALDVNGTIRTGKNNATNGSLIFSNSTNSNNVTINSGATSNSYALTLPLLQGASNSVLTNNGSGLLTWSAPSTISSGWTLIGNSGTNSSTNFIGTTDNQAFVVKVNNAGVARFEPNSTALGLAATTNNSINSYAMGSGAAVAYNFAGSFAIGNNSSVNNNNSYAFGNNAVVNGISSVAIGNGASSNGTNSLAIGQSAVNAYNISDGIAIGENATSNSNNSIAIGSNSVLANKTQTNAARAMAIGVSAISNSTNGIAIGTSANVAYNITEGIAIGTGATLASSLIAPIAIGNVANVNGNNGIAIGNGATVSTVLNGTAIGSGSNITGNNSTAIGNAAIVSGTNSTAIGYNTNVTQNNAVILGDLTNNALSVGIGSQSFNTAGNREKLLVDAGTTNSVNAIVGRGNINNYLQLNIQNQSSGSNASSDVVATANNGNETNNFVDMGINGSAYTGGIMGAANDAYLYNMGQNFLIGTGTSAKSVIFMTGGTSQATNERMRIDGIGNIGIGSINPGNKLEVNTGVAGTSGLRLKQLPTGGVLFMNSNADVSQNNNNFYFDAINYRLGIAAGTSPNSTLSVGGSISTGITTKTASYTASTNDYTILCNNTSGSITISLPSAIGCTGRVYVIKKNSTTLNNVVIDPNSSEKIDGATSKTLTNQYESIMIQSDGTNWYILSKN